MNHRTAAQRVARHPDILPLIAAYLGNPELRNLSCADRQTFEVASAKLWSTVPYAVAASIDGETARGRLYAAAVRHVIVSHTIEEGYHPILPLRYPISARGGNGVITPETIAGLRRKLPTLARVTQTRASSRFRKIELDVRGGSITVLIHINTAHAEQPQLQLPGDWTGFDFVWNVELFASTPSESRARMRDDVIHVAKALEGRATIISLGLCNSQLTLDGISNLLDEVTVAAASARITELDDGAAEGWNLSQLRFFAARHGAALTSFRLESHAYTSNRDEVALSELADAVACIRAHMPRLRRLVLPLGQPCTQRILGGTALPRTGTLEEVSIDVATKTRYWAGSLDWWTLSRCLAALGTPDCTYSFRCPYDPGNSHTRPDCTTSTKVDFHWAEVRMCDWDLGSFVRFLQTMPAAQFADFAAWHDRTTPAERASMGYDHAGLFRHARFGDDGHLLPRTGFEDASIQA